MIDAQTSPFASPASWRSWVLETNGKIAFTLLQGLTSPWIPQLAKNYFTGGSIYQLLSVLLVVLIPISDTLRTDFLTSHKSLCTRKSPLCCYTIHFPSHCLNWNEVAPAVFGQWKLYEYAKLSAAAGIDPLFSWLYLVLHHVGYSRFCPQHDISKHIPSVQPAWWQNTGYPL